ncbi:hypothetical protein [Haloferax elongans]|uniref:hypothetical protein n=1 Tax=Haloferax elongans TaxID=403191 RepID=UPI0012676CC1|nr:hypothetical protein [Haloferax elongans]
MNSDNAANLDSITIPSREEIKEAHEHNQFPGNPVRVVVDGLTGHQHAQVKEPHEYLEVSLSPKRLIRHIDGETWPTKADAETTVFQIDRYPNITYERKEEILNTPEFNNAVEEVWEEMKQRWWNEVEFIDEIKFGDSRTVAVYYEED